MNLILLGPPGAGKGTQASRIVKKYNIPHISTGDIFRKNISEGTVLGRKAQEYMNKGELVPNSLVIEIALDRLMDEDCKDGFLLDGFPRTVAQAEALDDFLTKEGKRLDHVLNMDVDKETLFERLITRRVCKACGDTYNIKTMLPKKEGICDSCGGDLYQRADDEAETVSNRIEVYNNQTKPLIDYYEKTGKIVHLDGAMNLEELFTKITVLLGD